jgi:inositol transport system substrate-binding protein
MKKYLAALLALAMTMTTLVGCGGGAAEAPAEETAGDVYKVAYIARAQSDSFAAWLANEMKAAADKYPDIELQVFDGQADDAKENAAIENAIANGFDAVIIQPNNGEAQRPYVEKVVEAGMIAITTNSRIEGIEGASSVDADPYNQAQVNAEKAIEQVPENAKVVILRGPSGNFHADERLKAWNEVFFAARPDVTIVGDDFANWNKDEAMALMEDWTIAHGDIDAVISMNDNMAAGALEVVKGNEVYDDMLVYGVDGTAEACLLIQEGKMTSTCLQSAGDLAALNMETVHKLLTGEATQIDTDIEEVLINADNVAEYVEMYKANGQITE